MGSVHKFKKRPQGKSRPFPWRKGKASFRRKGRSLPMVAIVAFGLIAGVVLGGAALWWRQGSEPAPDGAFSCFMPRVIDGDTFACGGKRVRLQGIDAPETEGHCRPGRDCAPGDPTASTNNLRRLVRWSKVVCRQTDTDVYGRAVALCSAGQTDLSCAQVNGGYAIYRYSPITC